MTASRPRITIITPSFNHARYLMQCIDSVLDQQYPHLQYMVLDGGSTDHTIDILRSYGDGIVWKSERDRGQAHAVNKGLRAATGDIIGWLNSDDYFLPGCFDRVVTCFDQHPEAGLVFGRALIVDDTGAVRREYPTFDLTRNDLARKCYICQPTVFVRRRVLETCGLLNDNLDVCLDYEWWLRIGQHERMVFCNHVLAASRHYPSTKTAARRLRALVEAGYLMREHFGRASWRWSAKWVAHRWSLNRHRFLLPVVGWWHAWRSAVRYHHRFDSRRSPSAYGGRLISHLRNTCNRLDAT